MTPLPLQQLAQRATKGPFRIQGKYIGSDGATVCDCDVSSIATADEKEANLHLHARCSPETLTAIYEALERAESAWTFYVNAPKAPIAATYNMDAAIVACREARQLLDGQTNPHSA